MRKNEQGGMEGIDVKRVMKKGVKQGNKYQTRGIHLSG